MGCTQARVSTSHRVMPSTSLPDGQLQVAME